MIPIIIGKLIPNHYYTIIYKFAIISAIIKYNQTCIYFIYLLLLINVLYF